MNTERWNRLRRPAQVVGVVALGAVLLSLALYTIYGPATSSSHTDNDSGFSYGDSDDSTDSSGAFASVGSYYDQHVVWEDCDDDLQCTSIEAPLDWDDPEGASISLALVKSPATGTRKGAILVNPGGPGESGVDFVANDVEDLVDEKVRKNYDIIGFDPRGVGSSSAVSCGDDADLDEYLYGVVPGAFGSNEWIDGQQKKAKAFAKACEQGTGALLGHIDTQSAARDLDLERAVLGEEKLNYLGYSYGTYLGTLYAGMFPENVGRFVLDGAYDPWNFAGLGATDIDTSQEEGFETQLREYIKSCLVGLAEATGDGACAFTGTTSSALTEISGLLTAADKHPLKNSDGRLLSSYTLSTAIFADLYDPSSWPDLNDLLTRVKAGDASTAFESSDSYNGRGDDGTYYDNSFVANLAINCLEYGGYDDRAIMKADAKTLEKAAPILGKYDAYSGIQCAAWGYGPTDFPDPVTASGAAPILVVGTTRDPATPYADAKALAKQLDSGVLVTYRGDGHTAYDRGVACIDNAVDRYFVDGVVPTSDPRCG